MIFSYPANTPTCPLKVYAIKNMREKLEIISWHFGHCPEYQPETPLLAREL